ncbi:MAG: pyridoxal phosphate-dependent aminotransferase family protein [Bacteroidales bacterium]|jgi:8-amino-7-oxononanoate synthase|nr:pyridoxal phosphate-dependent aminotransferase family protein [Bacteroidales bacterium]
MTISRKNLLVQRTEQYTEPQKFKAMGVYPYFRVIESDQDTIVTMNGREVLMFGSNSYLGLTNHPKIKEAAKAAIDKYGTGCAGSRFLNGTLDLHLELERKLADFVGKEAALAYSTGFQVNLGVVPTFTGRSDYIILDALDHASIIEGSRLSFSKVVKYKHNDMDSLEKTLQRCEPDKMKLIVVDGIFSMDGDIANLPGIVALSEKYNGTVMVDDAHSLGVLGKDGRGTAAHFGLTDRTDLIMGTFSKSLASIGGFIASDHATINFLTHHSRSLIFSASISPPAAASVIAALDIILSEPERIQHLWEVTHHAIRQLREAGFDLGDTETPIIPLMIRDNMKTFKLTKYLFDEGIFVNPVLSPAVANDSTLIRFNLMATHTYEQVDKAIDKIIKGSKSIGVI